MGKEIYDYSKLRGRIYENFGTVKAFLDEIGMSRFGWDNKMASKSSFTLKEFLTICKALKLPITKKTAYSYFMVEKTGKENL